MSTSRRSYDPTAPASAKLPPVGPVTARRIGPSPCASYDLAWPHEHRDQPGTGRSADGAVLRLANHILGRSDRVCALPGCPSTRSRPGVRGVRRGARSRGIRVRVLRDPDSSDPISLLRRYRAYAPKAREPPLMGAPARPSAWSTSLADDWSFSHIHPTPTVRGPAGPPSGAAPGRSTTNASPPVRTNSNSGAFARASTIALAGEGRAAGIARARGRREGAYASSRRRLLDWLRRAIAILLLRRQRGHAVQLAPGMWNGRRGRAATPAAECAPGFRSLPCSPPPTLGHTGPSLSRAWIRSTESFGRATNSYAPPRASLAPARAAELTSVSISVSTAPVILPNRPCLRAIAGSHMRNHNPRVRGSSPSSGIRARPGNGDISIFDFGYGIECVPDPSQHRRPTSMAAPPLWLSSACPTQHGTAADSIR